MLWPFGSSSVFSPGLDASVAALVRFAPSKARATTVTPVPVSPLVLKAHAILQEAMSITVDEMEPWGERDYFYILSGRKPMNTSFMMNQPQTASPLCKTVAQ